MTRKQIDAARERRLWLGQVIIPSITAAVTLASNDTARGYIIDSCNAVKSGVQKLFKKEDVK